MYKPYRALSVIGIVACSLLVAGCFETFKPTGPGGRVTISDIVSVIQDEARNTCKFIPDAPVVQAILTALGAATGVGIPAAIVGQAVNIICPLDQKLSQGRSARSKTVVVNGKVIRMTGKRVK